MTDDIASNVTIATLTISTWTHLSLSRNGNTIYVHVNGTLRASYNVGTKALYTPAHYADIALGEDYGLTR